MVRVEMSTQLLRLRSLVVLIGLAAIPVIAALATASNAGHSNGDQGGLFGAATYSALNHTVASLAFIEPQLLPIGVALLGAAIAASDHEWGILRYLYVAPVSRSRLLAGKLGALALFTLAATLSVVVAALVSGLVVFGWHPIHVIGAPTLSEGASAGRFLGACGYIFLCMLCVAAISFAVGLVLLRSAETLAAVVAFVIGFSVLNGVHGLHALVRAVPVHYWQDWTHLFEPGRAQLGVGAAVQVVWIAGAAGLSALVLRYRDPAA
jgi:ABC-2 type transport system permease protein